MERQWGENQEHRETCSSGDKETLQDLPQEWTGRKDSESLGRCCATMKVRIESTRRLVAVETRRRFKICLKSGQEAQDSEKIQKVLGGAVRL